MIHRPYILAMMLSKKKILQKPIVHTHTFFVLLVFYYYHHKNKKSKKRNIPIPSRKLYYQNQVETNTDIYQMYQVETNIPTTILFKKNVS